MWKFRCDMKYRSSKENNVTYRQRILLPKVHEINNQRHLLQDVDQQQFPITYDHILKLKTPQLKHWIKKNDLYLKESLHRYSLYLKNYPTINTFLPVVPQYTPTIPTSIPRNNSLHVNSQTNSTLYVN